MADLAGAGGKWRRVLIAIALGYLASVLGAAVPLVGSDVCRQYDGMALMVFAAPLLLLFGGFVIFALAVSEARDGSGLAFALLVGMGLGGALMTVLAVAAFRHGLGRVWSGVLLAGVAFVSAVCSFFFCLSMSV